MSYYFDDYGDCWNCGGEGEAFELRYDDGSTEWSAETDVDAPSGFPVTITKKETEMTLPITPEDVEVVARAVHTAIHPASLMVSSKEAEHFIATAVLTALFAHWQATGRAREAFCSLDDNGNYDVADYSGGCRKPVLIINMEQKR